MRELERDFPPATATPRAPAAITYLAIVGNGRAGGAIANAASAAGLAAETFGREAEPTVADPGASAVLLCVPDEAIAAACERLSATLPAGVPVGHVSGATPLGVLEPAARAGSPTFSMHPLQTIPSADTELAGAPCAIAGADAAALWAAQELAQALGMRPFEVLEESRAAYHAAASIASNFLVALEESAAGLLAKAGVADARDVLAPLVLRTAANWADAGDAALTGPIARGDDATVALHLRALEEHAPELVDVYEALAARTRELAARPEEQQ